MNPVKRVEIIVDRAERERVIGILHRIGVGGWTILSGASGSGDRGIRTGEGVPGSIQNDYILLACEPAMLDAIVKGITPILERWGGVCLVSDALWVPHEHDDES